MAGNYRVIGQRPTVQVKSATSVIDVEEVEFETIPSGVIAQVEVPLQYWSIQDSDPWIAPLATAIEELIGSGLAVGGSFVQDIDHSGLLTSFIQFIVAYDPPPPIAGSMTATVNIPVNDLTLDVGLQNLLPSGGPTGMLIKTRDALIATAGL